MKYKELEDAIIKKYSIATEFYLLQRNRKMSKKEYLFDWLVALFTPIPGIVEEADIVSDMGTYFLVISEKKQLLVRTDSKENTEKDITNISVSPQDKKFIVENNRFKKVKKVYG